MGYPQWIWIGWQVLGFLAAGFGDYSSNDKRTLAISSSLLGITLSNIILYWGGVYS